MSCSCRGEAQREKHSEGVKEAAVVAGGEAMSQQSTMALRCMHACTVVPSCSAAPHHDADNNVGAGFRHMSTMTARACSSVPATGVVLEATLGLQQVAAQHYSLDAPVHRSVIFQPHLPVSST
jgi:hypothetical protein